MTIQGTRRTIPRRSVGAALLALAFSAPLNAQVAPAVTGLEADAGRGILTERTGPIETQVTCPQRVGDAWDTTNERTWNMLEFGVQILPADFPDPKFQLYTRYTCDAPFDRPKRRQF